MADETEQPEQEFINPAGTPLEEYRAFIDGLLEWPRVSVPARWAREWGNKPSTSTYQTPADFDAKMHQFTPEQRQVVAELMQEEHEGGIYTFLAYLTDKINIEGLRLHRNGVPLAIEPYGSEMYYD